MAWTGLILFCLSNIFGLIICQDKTIHITLVPYGYTDPREDDQFICGLVKTLDQNRFLAEQNSDFIFQFVDNTNDPSPDCKTKIFDVAKLSDSGELRKLEPCLDLEYEVGLFTLVMAPPTAECNQETFKNAKDGKDYYPVYIGDKDGITYALEKYKSQANIHKKVYTHGHPKLCGTFTSMESRAAKSRAENLATIFNFPFNKDVSRRIDVDEHQECRSATETKKAIIKSEVFDTSIEPSFKETEQKVFEFEGVFQATLTRASSGKAAVIIVKPILDGSATAYDVDPFESLVVFMPSATEVDVFVTIREDGVSENDEEFKLEISNFAKTRKKRAVGQTIDVKILDNILRKFVTRDLLEMFVCSTRFNTDRFTIQPKTKDKAKNMESNTIVEFILSREEIILIKKFWTKTIREKKFVSRKPVNFIEIYDAQDTKHKQVKEKDRLKAYYYPYYSGYPEIEKDGKKVLNVGWVDIPKKPNKDQPKHAITGTMNGCATLVMTKKNDDKKLRVYHLQNPGNRGEATWNNYIEIIKKHHGVEVDAVLTSFSWEDYGYSEKRGAEIAKDPSAYSPAAVVLLIYDTASQEWYYASQMNLYGMHVNRILVSNEESIFNGKTEQVLVSKMKDRGRPPAKRCDDLEL